MDYVNVYPCPTCRTSFAPESHVPLRLECPQCKTRWFLELRTPWLAGGYVVAYAVGMAASFIWPTRTAAIPVFVFAGLFLAAFWKSFALASSTKVEEARRRYGRNPFSLWGMGLLGAATAAAFTAAAYPAWLTPLAVIAIGLLPPAFTMTSFRFAAFFASRGPAYALLVTGVVLVFGAPWIFHVSTFLVLLLRFVGMFVTLGALAGAAAPRPHGTERPLTASKS